MVRSILIALALTFPWYSLSQQRITVTDIYKDQVFREKTVADVRWMKDGRYYTARDGQLIIQYDITNGSAVDTLFDGSSTNPAIRFTSYSFSEDESKILLLTDKQAVYRRSFTAIYYVYDLASGKFTRLSDQGRQSYATFSPDNRYVAFVRSNNLYYVELEQMEEVQVTSDGSFNQRIHGSTDWVYEEELSFTRAFEWAENGAKLFYLTFDEREVPQYNMQKWNAGQLYPEDYRFKYPKAGEKNAVVTATVYDLQQRTYQTVDLGSDQEYYVARILPTHDPEILSIMRLNRLQNQLDILHLHTSTGVAHTILSEKYDTYVDIDFIDDLTYLTDGEHFIHASEKSGYKHLYLYTINGELVHQITSGAWEVDAFLGVDMNSKQPLVYYTSTELSPLDRSLYVIQWNGKRKQVLRGGKGVHTIDMSPDYTYYLDYYSSSGQPLQVTLHRTQPNEQIKVLEQNRRLRQLARAYGFSDKTFFTFPIVDSTLLNGYMLQPHDFDSTQSYPVLIYQYSGPGSQEVLHDWDGGHYYWHQLLAQEGYVVAVIDSRGTGGRGAAFKKMTYGQLGKYESEDFLAAARYLGEIDFIDADRIGIWGWSYGGYMSSLAMFLGGGLFKAAIAVAPVTSWRFYDTIYTERYMGLPKGNPEGYDAYSPLSHAAKLEGSYLLVHGTGDDNVHFQNAVALQDALILAGKQFDSFYYPDRAHGIRANQARIHLFTMLTQWVKEHL